jgi:hypothetical protein
VGRVRRFTLLAGALLGWALSAAAVAHGAIPVAPPDGARVNATPTFAWGPGPGEEANQIELSPKSTLDEDGSFVDDPRERRSLLDSTQTSYTIAASEPLTAGTWFWHVETMNYDIHPCCSRWTEVRSVVVGDAPIQLSSFKLGFLRGLDELVFRAAYTDNSVDLAARYRLVFKKRRRGHRVATVKGKLDKGSFQNGEAFASTHRPRRLHRGRRYLVRLELRDAAGHVARSHFVRIRL